MVQRYLFRMMCMDGMHVLKSYIFAKQRVEIPSQHKCVSRRATPSVCFLQSRLHLRDPGHGLPGIPFQMRIGHANPRCYEMPITPAPPHHHQPAPFQLNLQPMGSKLFHLSRKSSKRMRLRCSSQPGSFFFRENTQGFPIQSTHSIHTSYFRGTQLKTLSFEKGSIASGMILALHALLLPENQKVALETG